MIVPLLCHHPSALSSCQCSVIVPLLCHRPSPLSSPPALSSTYCPVIISCLVIVPLPCHRPSPLSSPAALSLSPGSVSSPPPVITLNALSLSPCSVTVLLLCRHLLLCHRSPTMSYPLLCLGSPLQLCHHPLLCHRHLTPPPSSVMLPLLLCHHPLLSNHQCPVIVQLVRQKIILQTTVSLICSSSPICRHRFQIRPPTTSLGPSINLLLPHLISETAASLICSGSSSNLPSSASHQTNKQKNKKSYRRAKIRANTGRNSASAVISHVVLPITVSVICTNNTQAQHAGHKCLCRYHKVCRTASPHGDIKPTEVWGDRKP